MIAPERFQFIRVTCAPVGYRTLQETQEKGIRVTAQDYIDREQAPLETFLCDGYAEAVNPTGQRWFLFHRGGNCQAHRPRALVFSATPEDWILFP